MCGSSTVTNPPHDRSRVGILLIGAVLVAAFLSLNNLGARSIWYDEAESIRIASLDFSRFWGALSQQEANMAFYFLLLKFWMALGTNEFAVRLFSAVCSVATVPVIYLIGKRIFTVRVGVTAAWLLAANAFFIRYAQEARSYGLLLFLVSASSYLFLTCLENPTKKKWAMYVTISALAAYAHFFALLVPLCHGTSILFIKRNDINWRSLGVSFSLIGLSVVPLLLFIVGRDTGQVDWIAPMNLLSLPGLFFAFSGLVDLIAVALYVIIFPLGMARMFLISRESAASPLTWRYAFLLLWLFLPIGSVMLISLAKPLFVSRYFIICLPPFLLISAFGLAGARPRFRHALGTAVAIGISINSVYTSYGVVTGADWRSATRFLLTSARADDVVIPYRDYQAVPFQYYCQMLSGQRNPVAMARPSFARMRHPMLSAAEMGSDSLLSSLGERKGGRIWLIICNDFPDGRYGYLSFFGRDVKEIPLSGKKVKGENVETLVRKFETVFRFTRTWKFEKITVSLVEPRRPAGRQDKTIPDGNSSTNIPCRFLAVTSPSRPHDSCHPRQVPSGKI